MNSCFTFQEDVALRGANSFLQEQTPIEREEKTRKQDLSQGQDSSPDSALPFT